MAPGASPATSIDASPRKVDLAAITPKYQYYQNDKTMTIVILEPNVREIDLKVEYETNQRIHVLLHKNGHVLHLIHGELYDSIIPEKCKVSIRVDKVLIKLCKENVNYEWHTLLSDSKSKKNTVRDSLKGTEPTEIKISNSTTEAEPMDHLTVPTSTGALKKSSVPTPYATHRDWEQIEKDIDTEMQQETPVGDEAMNQLFQQIYANSSDDTRRAMIKSYQTSGGTVLSTNWEEVKEKDYEKERTAPEGQEWKTWDGRKV
jgi:suppressor of G2 allele of SKP1